MHFCIPTSENGEFGHNTRNAKSRCLNYPDDEPSASFGAEINPLRASTGSNNDMSVDFDEADMVLGS
jgi:hypothetical protein